jgi:D-sedoheptulose 7-phosphate isomerase
MEIMKYTDLITQQLTESAQVKEELIRHCLPEIEQCGVLCADVLKNGGKLLLCGNGGSAADAQHIAAELVVRLSAQLNRNALPVIALTVNTSILTACANDFGFDTIFSRQVEAYGQQGDVLIGISTSGKSPNVYQALELAKSRKLHTIGFLGVDGGTIKDIVDIALIVPHTDTARIQEAHITVGHIICHIIEQELFVKK